MLITELGVDGHSPSMDFNVKIWKFIWRIENFSSIKDQKLYSEDFIVNGYKWRILIFPKGNYTNHLSIYLSVSDSATLESGWMRYAQFGLAVVDQIDRRTSITEVTNHNFSGNQAQWGFTSFLALDELHDPGRGYLINDACIIEAYVSTYSTTGLISRELIVESDSLKHKHKIKEADCAKAAIDDQKTTIIIPVGITTPPSSQPSSLAVAIEPEEPSDRDMNAFFTTLESELFSHIVFSQEEAKEALDKLDEALNMAPVNFHDSGNFSPLKQAFKILARLDCSSTTITTDQKNEVLAMEGRLKGLADRAVKAAHDKNQLLQKELIKLTTTRNLDRNLVRYKEIESEMTRLMAERKEIFKSSKKMKMDLESLGKDWPEYEANAKAAAEEVKTVETEWGRMKDFIAYIKEHWERNEPSTSTRSMVLGRRRRRLLIHDWEE